MKKNSILSMLLIMIFLILLGCSSRERKEELYQEKFRVMGEIMVKQASACISLSRSYVAIWEYAKVTGTDFETAVAELQGEEFERSKREFRASRSKIKQLLEDLSEPPLKYAESYERLVELYDIYLEIHSLAMNPSGPMESFNDSINDLQNELVEKKAEFDLMLKEVTK